MGAKYTAEDEKALRDFLLDEDCLEELLPWTERFNIFDVLKISRTEIRHSNQLNRYRTILEKEYEEYKKIYLFLTPDGDVPSDPENWEAISYRELIDELERITANVELLPDAELMIKNYIEIIRRDIVEDQELVEICNKIYQKHKRAFELIYENKTDNRSVVVDSLLEPLKKYENEGKIKIDYKYSYILFNL